MLGMRASTVRTLATRARAAIREKAGELTMIDDRELFERAVQRFAPAERSFERLVARRDRRKRNQRITAAVVGIAAALAVALTGASLLRSESRPAGPNPGPSVRNGEITVADYPGDGDGLRAIDPADGTVRQLVTCVDSCYEIRGAEWSPDGTRLAYFEASYGNPNTSGIYVLDIRSGEATRLTHCAKGCVQGGFSWSPDSSRIAYPGPARDRRAWTPMDRIGRRSPLDRPRAGWAQLPGRPTARGSRTRTAVRSS